MTITEPRATVAAPTIEELDEELADLQTIIEWQTRQISLLRYAVGGLLQGNLGSEWRQCAHKMLYPSRGPGQPTAGPFYRYQRPARRWAKFAREALLELLDTHGVTRPGIRRCSREMIERTLRGWRAWQREHRPPMSAEEKVTLFLPRQVVRAIVELISDGASPDLRETLDAWQSQLDGDDEQIAARTAGRS